MGLGVSFPLTHDGYSRLFNPLVARAQIHPYSQKDRDLEDEKLATNHTWEGGQQMSSHALPKLLTRRNHLACHEIV